MDRQGRFPLLTWDEREHATQFLEHIPEFVLWDAALIVLEFKNKLRGWHADEEWFSQIIEMMIEYIADYDSAPDSILAYTDECIADIGSSAQPYSPQQVGAAIVELGHQMRETLRLLGFYQYKRTLLYKFYRFVLNDILLVRLHSTEATDYGLDESTFQLGPMNFPIQPPSKGRW